MLHIRRVLTIGAALSLCPLPCSAATAAAPRPSAEKFVRMLYMKLADAGRKNWSWDRDLSRSTLQLKQRVDTLYVGEVADYMDADWLCQCQDVSGYRVTSLKVLPQPHRGAEVTVYLSRAGNPIITTKLNLIDEGGWKIAEIIDNEGRRYTAALQYDIRHARR